MNKNILEHKINNIEPKNINSTIKYINTLNIIYYNKYIKYKYKFLYLKKKMILQHGGDLPNFTLLKGINLFNCPIDCEPYTKEMISGVYNELDNLDELDDRGIYNLLSNHLCLVHGFIWVNTGLIENYCTFYKLEKNQSLKIIQSGINKDDIDGVNTKGSLANKLFHKVNEKFRPTNNFIDPESKLTTKLLGIFMGILFFKYIFSKYINQYKNNNKIEEIKKIYNSFMTISDKGVISGNIFDKLQKLEKIDLIIINKGDTKILSEKVLDNDIRIIKKLFNTKFFNIKSIKYIDQFHICLSVILWLCNTEQEIINYYIGLYICFKAILKIEGIKQIFTDKDKDMLNINVLKLFNPHEIFNFKLIEPYQRYNSSELYNKTDDCCDWLESLVLSYLDKKSFL